MVRYGHNSRNHCLSGEEIHHRRYVDTKGNSQAFDYAEALEGRDQKKLAALLMVIGDIGQLRNTEKFRSEGDKIYAFKPQPHRFLSFFYAGKKSDHHQWVYQKAG